MTYDLDELERLEKLATPGPWSTAPDDDNRSRSQGVWAGPGGPWDEPIIKTDSGVYPPDQVDADLIVAARNALPALIRDLRAARARPAHRGRQSGAPGSPTGGPPNRIR